MDGRGIRIIELCCEVAVVVLLGLVLALGGCQRNRKVLDVEAPGVDVEVQKNTDTGEVTVHGQSGDENTHNSGDAHEKVEP
jgi:hypothetical protein